REFECRQGQVSRQEVVDGALVVVFARLHRPENGELVGLFSGERQMLANLYSRDASRDRLELAANLFGRIWFQIERVQMAATAALPQQEAGDVPLGSGSQQAVQANPQGA